MFRWNEEKNNILKAGRNITFEEIIENGKILAKQLNKSINHPNQWEFHIKYQDYIYRVPYVTEENGDIFLKTIFKDRKLLKTYKDLL